MVTLPPRRWKAIDGLAALLAALGGDRGETRFIGGFVRDALAGSTGKDIDLATIHPPEETMRRVRAAGLKAVPTGLAHGTVTAVLAGSRIEVTTLRRDVATDGRHATVAFTDDWRADASRRDFTINALSAEPGSGVVHDYFDGVADLAAGRVRFIGDPLSRIAEDHLRILRFFRFQARFGAGEPDAAALAGCSKRANDLLALSRERIAAELLSLLGLPDPAATVALMIDHAILKPVLPEIDGHGGAALQRLIGREARAGVAADGLRRLAALLPRDPALAEQVGARLKLSNAQRQRLIEDATPAPPGAVARRLAFGGRPEIVIDRLLLGAADESELLAGLESLADWAPPRLPLGGGELIALGLPRGPVVAKTLAALQQAWIDADYPDDAWLRATARSLVDQALRDNA